MWDLPRPGLKPMTPASAGGFLTTAPPGKPLSYNLLRLTLPMGPSSKKKEEKLMGIPPMFLGPQFLWPETRVPLRWGFRCVAIPCCYYNMQDCLGTAVGKNQRRKKEQSKKKTGTSSTFCLAGDPFPAPQTRNRGLLFELSFRICCVLLGFKLKGYHLQEHQKV